MANKSLRAATRLRLSLLAQALVLAGVAQPVLAADWTVTPNLTVSERYTDNVNLAPAGPRKESDLITEVRPGVNISKVGRRLKVNINYSLQSLTYLNNNQNNNLNHQLNAVVNAELLEDFLFLDVNSAVYQTNINALAPIGLGNANATNNLTTVGTYSISPYIRKRFGILIRRVFPIPPRAMLSAISQAAASSTIFSGGWITVIPKTTIRLRRIPSLRKHPLRWGMH
jgi:hypothetical protein